MYNEPGFLFVWLPHGCWLQEPAPEVYPSLVQLHQPSELLQHCNPPLIQNKTNVCELL